MLARIVTSTRSRHLSVGIVPQAIQHVTGYQISQNKDQPSTAFVAGNRLSLFLLPCLLCSPLDTGLSSKQTDISAKEHLS